MADALTHAPDPAASAPPPASPPDGAVLFEAITTAPPGLSASGLRLVAVVVVLFALVSGGVFAAIGAWPVLGFTGAEAALVLGLLALHRRGSRRAMEMLRLADGRLTIERVDWRGRRETFEFDPFWARLSLEARPGRVSALLLRQRRTAVEVGQLLGEDQKQDLAAALAEALRRYREPVFDNPQLHDPPGDPAP
jgi:uncharacterized membrane protein